MAKAYLAALYHVVGEDITDRLLEAFDDILDGDEHERRRVLRAKILGVEMPEDVARTLRKLWYSEHGPNFSIAGPTASAQNPITRASSFPGSLYRGPPVRGDRRASLRCEGAGIRLKGVCTHKAILCRLPRAQITL